MIRPNLQPVYTHHPREKDSSMQCSAVHAVGINSTDTWAHATRSGKPSVSRRVAKLQLGTDSYCVRSASANPRHAVSAQR